MGFGVVARRLFVGSRHAAACRITTLCSPIRSQHAQLLLPHISAPFLCLPTPPAEGRIAMPPTTAVRSSVVACSAAEPPTWLRRLLQSLVGLRQGSHLGWPARLMQIVIVAAVVVGLGLLQMVRTTVALAAIPVDQMQQALVQLRAAGGGYEGESEEDLLAFYQELFAGLHPDWQGRVKAEQLQQLPLQLHFDIIAAFDRDANGLVDFKEFLSGFLMLRELSKSPPPPREHVDKLLFSILDEDGNGVVSLVELTSWISAAVAFGLVPDHLIYTNTSLSNIKRRLPDMEVARRILRGFDSNNDGVLDFAEFVQFSAALINVQIFEQGGLHAYNAQRMQQMYRSHKS